ncbi:HAD family hydrolase [Streptomyces sp. NPDC056704]|uniref:HAD family hydrolase n=1 Tax=Streptomyces sp. NPDC056704 TaxID=3345917 RepID=UPI0036B8F2AB
MTRLGDRSRFLVIFDCDGVLVESEPGETLAILDVARRYGYQAGEEEALRAFRGRKLAEVAEVIGRTLGGGAPEGFEAEVRRRCAETVDHQVKAPPGTAAALDRIGGPHCVASSSPPEVIRARLGAAGLLERFGERIYSAYQVGSWKPSPGLFLHAAATERYAPADCVVVEDSLVGVAAARAAGMRVVLFGAERSRLPESDDLRGLAHMSGLPEVLNSLMEVPV